MTKAKILIVEDEAIVACDIEGSLTSLGYTVSANVSFGEEAVKKAREDKPDLVLMDIMLRGDMDGIEAAETIHSELDIPVVYLTAYASNDLIERAKITEPFGYIIKPFEDRDLVSAIEIAIYNKGIRVKLRQHYEDIKRMNKLMVERKLDMADLKKENERLRRRIKELEGT